MAVALFRRLQSPKTQHEIKLGNAQFPEVKKASKVGLVFTVFGAASEYWR